MNHKCEDLVTWQRYISLASLIKGVQKKCHIPYRDLKEIQKNSEGRAKMGTTERRFTIAVTFDFGERRLGVLLAPVCSESVTCFMLLYNILQVVLTKTVLAFCSLEDEV